MGRFEQTLREKEANSPWLKLKDGEQVRAKFIEAVEVIKSMDGKRTKFMSADLDINGVIKAFESSSIKAFQFFNDLKAGTMITIARQGSGTKTKYDYTAEGQSPF